MEQLPPAVHVTEMMSVKPKPNKNRCNAAEHKWSKWMTSSLFWQMIICWSLTHGY